MKHALDGRPPALAVLTALGLLACAAPDALRPEPLAPGIRAMTAAPPPDVPTHDALIAQTERFAAVPFEVDLSGLSEVDRAALVPLIQASQVLDRIFDAQMWSRNAALRASLEADAATPEGAARLAAFEVNRGPWSELDGYRAFLPDVPERKPLGAAFYPEDATSAEIEAWLASLSEPARGVAHGFYSVLRRDPAGGLAAEPYAAAYRSELAEAAGHLRRAAALTTDATLRTFLSLRADALASDDYRPSEVAWMELDAPIDLTFGPYETYLDELMGLKAAFEAYLGLRDEAESRRLAAFSSHLLEIERHLPMPDAHKRTSLGALAPIAVVNQLFNAGDAAHGVQAAAFNLPNDEAVVAQKGSKRVMLKNVQEAKFEAILKPIAARLLPASALEGVTFEAFFLHILAHELGHGLGPQRLNLDGRETTVRQALGEVYSAIEEAKADLLGLFMVQHFLENRSRLGLAALLPDDLERTLYTTFLASSFRTLRFGIEEAHARSMAMQFNAFVEAGAFQRLQDGRFKVVPEAMKVAVRDLLGRLLVIQAEGDRAGARALLAARAVLTPEMKEALARLEGVAVDIRPVFVTANELLRQAGISSPGQ